MKFTKTSVAALALPAGKVDHIVFDDDTAGFGVRLRSTGSRIWIAQMRINGRTRRMAIGDVGRIELETARGFAKRFFAQALLGTDPIAAREEARAKAAVTVGPTIESYLKDRESALRPSSYKQVARCLKRYFIGLHPLPVSSVGRADVAAAVRKVAEEHGKIAAARAHLSAFFAWCLREGIGGESNPVANTNNPAPYETPRDRILALEEVKAIWLSLPDTDFGKVASVTPCRG
jgi:hypothetical protein